MEDKSLHDQDYDDGFLAGLHGRPMGFVSPMFDAGWEAGRDKRRERERADTIIATKILKP